MTLPIRSTLNEFAQAIDRAAPAVSRQLAPGLSMSAISEMLSQLTDTPPDELTVLYRWHNGYHVEGGPSHPLFLGWQPISLEDGLNRFMEERALVTPYREGLRIDRSSWLAIFWQPEYAALYADLGSASPRGEVPIFKVHEKDASPRHVCNSLNELVTAWSALLAVGVSWNGTKWIAPKTIDAATLAAAGY